MEQHNAATEIDRKIIETADSIGRLTSKNASFRELKTQWESLSDLIEQKRKLLYTAPDVSFYLDQFFACATMEERRVKAVELAEDILAFMNQVFEADDYYDPVEMETASSVLAFFRSFRRPAAAEEAEEADSQDASVAGVSISSFADFSVETCKYFLEILEPLVRDGFISAENARFLGNRIKGLPLLEGETTTIEWLGGLKALATLLTVLYAFGSLEIGTKKPKGAAYSEKRPVLSSFIQGNFTLPEKPSDRTIANYAKDSYEDFRVFCDQVEEIRRERSKSPVIQPLGRTKDIISYYFNQLVEYRTTVDKFGRLCRKLDWRILRLVHELLEREER